MSTGTGANIGDMSAAIAESGLGAHEFMRRTIEAEARRWVFTSEAVPPATAWLLPKRIAEVIPVPSERLADWGMAWRDDLDAARRALYHTRHLNEAGEAYSPYCGVCLARARR